MKNTYIVNFIDSNGRVVKSISITAVSEQQAEYNAYKWYVESKHTFSYLKMTILRRDT